MNAALRPASDRRLAALAFTALVHALLLLGWQMTRRLPAPVMADPPGIQWIDLRSRARTQPQPTPMPAREAVIPQAIHVLPAPASPAPVAVEPAPIDSGAAAANAAPGAASTAVPGGPLLQGALRAAGAIDKALRKENRAYIVAPPDSPQMRMQRGMQAAHDMAAPRLWEAPKIEELVNNTGDGTHHTRVITGNGTYCINERSTHVSIDTIETLGKVTPHLTCPAHETPAGSQEWKTARD